MLEELSDRSLGKGARYSKAPCSRLYARGHNNFSPFSIGRIRKNFYAFG